MGTKRGVPTYLSAGAVACLAVGFILVFVGPMAGETLIGAGLALWATSFWLNRKAIRSDFTQRLFATREKVLLDGVEAEITGQPGGVVTRTLCGVDLGTSLRQLEDDPAWEEVEPETSDLFKTGLKPGARLFGHGRINLMTGVMKNEVHRISLFLPRTRGLAGLLERIHRHYGTIYKEQEEWTLWEDERTKLELLSREDGAHLTLLDRDDR